MGGAELEELLCSLVIELLIFLRGVCVCVCVCVCVFTISKHVPTAEFARYQVVFA